MKIFKDNIELVDLVVSDESYRYRTIMGENALTLTFSLNTFIEIPVGAYADFQGERYTLLVPQNFKKNDSRNFEYTLILESSKSLLGRYKFRDSSTKKLKFSTTAKPIEHLEVLVWNLNQRDSGWSVGECIDSTEKLLSFNHTYCDEVLKMIAEAFNTEYEIVGKVISLKKVEYNKSNPLALSYGFGNGFKSGVKRDNFNQSKAIEVLYVQGGEKNIDSTAYGSSELLLPKNQTLVYQGRSYISDENGYSIKRADKPLSTYIEDSLDLSNIYPSRVGVISEVVTVNSEKNFYDIKDSSIPESLNYTDCLVKGETMTIIFQTGMLTGKEFDVSYNHTSRKFEIIPQEIDGVTMPGSVFIPVVGDKYVVFGMSLPEAYMCDNTTKTGASWDMFLEAVKYFSDNEDPRFSFTGDLDGIWAKKDWLNIGGKIILGGFCAFTDEQFQNTPVLIRMVGIKDYINDPHYPQIELSNVTVGNTTSSQIKSIPTKDVLIEDSKKDSIRFAKRGFRDAKQTTEMLQSALLNFSSSISPLTVQTMQLIAGDETLQFEFVASSTSTASVAHNENYNPETKQFISAAGVLQHKTLGVTTLSSSHTASELKWWNMTAFVSAVLDDSSKSYYLYAKVSKTANTGVFLLSETAIALESVDGYYHLLMGILNSENDGDRSYSQFYGYSELTPARMTVKKVVSPSGNTFFDLENEVIQGNIKFQSGVAVETGISNAKSEAVQLASNDATNKANAVYLEAKSYADAIGADKQAQIDGQIISWFRQVDALLTNSPASDWTTETLRNQHANDTYTNTSNGKCWRFQYNGSTSQWEWGVIADTATQQALTAAGTATAIANGKRTVFDSQPTTPYLAADLWLNNGDLYKCTTARSTGSFVSGDWSKAVKYTDDTAVNNMQIGGRNIIRNSSRFTNLTGWTSNGGTLTVDSTVLYDGYNTLKLTNTTASGINTDRFRLKPNSKYTISAYVRANQNYSGNYDALLHMQTWTDEDSSNVHQDVGITSDNNLAANVWKKVQATFSTPNSPTLCYGVFYFYPLDASIALNIAYVKLEEGTKATDWTPSAEDVEADATAKANAAQTAAISTAAIAAQAKADLAELNAKAHADGIVTAEEQRAINDATTKANNAQTAAINAASADATAKANVVQTNLNNLQIGGRNLATGSRNFSGNILPNYQNRFGVKQSFMYNGCDVYKTDVNWLGFRFSGIPTTTTPTIISFMAKVDSGTNAQIINLSGSTDCIMSKSYVSSTEWRKYWVLYPSGTSLIGGTSNQGLIEFISGFVYYSQIQLELGNKATDWTEAPEDDYIKKAIKGSASINGGLVLGNVMAVTDENGNVMAGMNGLAGAQYPIWSGAPNASNANFSVDKYGNLKAFSGQFGNFMIENGALVGYANNTEKVRLHTGVLPALDSLVNSNWVRYALEFNTSGVIGGVVNDFHNDLFVDTVYSTVTGYLSIPSNTNVKFHAQIIDTVSASPPDGIEISDFIQMVKVYNSGGSLVATNYLDGANVYLSAGTYLVKYTFQVSVNFNIQTTADIVVVSDSNAWMEYQGGITRLEMANDGFFMYYNATEYFYFKQGVGKFEKGFTDSPGVLATGSVASGSTHSNKWGAKKCLDTVYVTKGGTGIYYVPHLGGANYTVQLTCLADNVIARVTSRGTNTFTVTIRNMSGTLTDAAFDYTIYGAN